MKDLLVICPSRNRVANVERLIDAWHDTDATCDLLIGADYDDPTDYEALGVIVVERGPRLGAVGTINRLGALYAHEYSMLGIIGDDQLPRTRCWDQVLINRIDQMGIGIVYADDLFQREKHPTGVVISSSLVRTLGFVAPESLHHMYADDFWKRLGTDLDRIAYVPEVIIEHMHPVCGKAPMDESYAESGAWMAADGEAFARYIATDYESDLAKCRHLLERW